MYLLIYNCHLRFHFIDLPSCLLPSSSLPLFFLSLFHAVYLTCGVRSLIHIQCWGHLCASNMHGPACRGLTAKLTASQCYKRMLLSFWVKVQPIYFCPCILQCMSRLITLILPRRRPETTNDKICTSDVWFVSGHMWQVVVLCHRGLQRLV